MLNYFHLIKNQGCSLFSKNIYSKSDNQPTNQALTGVTMTRTVKEILVKGVNLQQVISTAQFWMQEQGITSDSITTSLIAGRMVIGGITDFFVVSLSENYEGTFIHTEGWTKIAGQEHDFSNDSSLGGVPRKRGFEAVSSLMNKLESLNQKSAGLPPNQLPMQGTMSSTYSVAERLIKYPTSVSSYRRMVTWLKRPKSMAKLLSAIWIICVLAAIFANPIVISAKDYNGVVMGISAANPNMPITLVDTISDINYAPPSPYNLFGVTSDVTTISFESASTKSGGLKLLFISGDLTDSYKVGDKIIIRFTLNQQTAGMTTPISTLPASSVQHYSPIGLLNPLPIGIAIALTILGIGFLLKTRTTKTIKLPPPPQPMGEQIPPPP